MKENKRRHQEHWLVPLLNGILDSVVTIWPKEQRNQGPGLYKKISVNLS